MKFMPLQKLWPCLGAMHFFHNHNRFMKALILQNLELYCVCFFFPGCASKSLEISMVPMPYIVFGVHL